MGSGDGGFDGEVGAAAREAELPPRRCRGGGEGGSLPVGLSPYRGGLLPFERTMTSGEAASVSSSSFSSS